MRCGAVETRAASRYRRFMPNRKTFDPREKYDHSGRPVGHAEENDLKPDISEEAAEAAGVGREGGDRAARSPRKTTVSRNDKPPAGR
jgi:hypothetical protein